MDMEKLLFTYEVITPITDYGFNKKAGDLMTTKELQSIPPYYKKCVKLLNSPVVKLIPKDFGYRGAMRNAGAKDFNGSN